MATFLLLLAAATTLLSARSGMTLPVPVIPGANLLVTRRTYGRCCLLRPGPVVNQIMAYALGYTSQKYEIDLYAHVSLSNHHHTPCRDPHGLYPEFCREFHSLTARSLNAFYGRSEALWSPGRGNAVILVDDEALLNAISYSEGNPQLSNLIGEFEEWPGLLSRIDDLGGPPRRIERPAVFFDPEGKLPDFVELRFIQPPCLDMALDEYREEIARRVHEKIAQARAERPGVRPLGRIAVLSQDPSQPPKSRPKKRENSAIRPLIACGQELLRRAVLAWLKAFRVAHRAARLVFEAGDGSAEFPFGTYFHLRRYGVNCSAVGPPPAASDLD